MTCKSSDIIIKPQELKFIAQEGYRFVLPYQYIYLEKATHDLTPSWAAATDATWLSIRPTSGEVPERIRVEVDSREMAAGIYHGLITFSSHVSVSPTQVMIILEVELSKVEPEQPEPEEKLPEQPEETPEETPEPTNWLQRLWELLRKLFDLWKSKNRNMQ